MKERKTGNDWKKRFSANYLITVLSILSILYVRTFWLSFPPDPFPSHSPPHSPSHSPTPSLPPYPSASPLYTPRPSPSSPSPSLIDDRPSNVRSET